MASSTETTHRSDTIRQMHNLPNSNGYEPKELDDRIARIKAEQNESSRLAYAYSAIAHLDSEPMRYDPEEVSRLYGKQPLKVLSRLFNIFWPTLTFALSLWVDKKLGRSKKMEPKRAIRLRDLLTELGPAYIKVGQALSTRPDLVPPIYLEELSQLQDQLPPFPNEVAYRFIEEELGDRPQNVYAELSESPIAAASLGQVYKGKLKTGETVAVKVQRPDLTRRISLDIYVLRQLARLATRLIKDVKSDLIGIMDEFGARIYEEMDYIHEGLNAERFAELYGQIPDIYVPKIYWEHTNRRVLTMEWITGTKLTKPDEIRAQGVDAGHLVNVGVQCSLRQLLEHGFFHADPHPGNLLATPEGKLAYLDFGMMSEVKPPQRYGLLEAVVHLVNRDFEGLASDYVKLEFLSPETDLTPIIPAFSSVFSDALGASVAELNFKSITDQLSAIMYEYPFRVPAYYALIIRSLVTLEGIAIKVDPNFKVLSKAYPYVSKRLLSDPSPELRASLQDLLFKDGEFRWNRLENLLRNASNSPDYDPNQVLKQTVDFLFSDRGAFIRDYLINESVASIDAFGRQSMQQLAFSLRQRIGFGDSGSVNPNATGQDSDSSVDHIIQILTILRETPGFDPKLLLDVVPRLLSNPAFHSMGRDIAGGLMQRAIARFIREFFLHGEEEASTPYSRPIASLPPHSQPSRT
ncbi:MAG: AarF/ABC1/UbiB kinase family protein [Elainellaceae cyanobacterium]